MTVLDDAPSVQIDVDDPAVPAPRRVQGWATWRFASRLARREVRRRPGRTLLVAALVAVPVLAMTMAITIARSATDSPQQQFERSSGQADLMLDVGELTSSQIDDAIAALPTGSRAVRITTANTRLTATEGQVAEWVDFRIAPFGDPLLDGIYDVTEGRVPSAPGEVLLHRDVADELGVDVGDTVALERPSGEWTVVGIGRANDYFDQPIFAVIEFPADRLRDGSSWVRVLADLPDDVVADDLVALIGRGPAWIDLAPRLGPTPDSIADERYWSPRVDVEVQPEALAWGWVAGALTLAAVGVIIAAAFASSARRQLATIGQLSANGAPEGLIRRTLALQGAWTGAIGALAGVVIGLVAVRFTRPLVELVIDRPLGGWRIDVLALVVILLTGVAAATFAAMVPARSAAKVPVLAALAGRRPLGAVPRALVPIGALLFLAGVGLLVLVTIASTDNTGENGNLYAAVALLGGLGVIAGMCCASPIAVDGVGRLGARLSGTWRLAARSVARSRTRSAGVMTAVAVTGAAAIAVTTVIGSLAFGDERSTPTLPDDTVVITSITYDGEGDGGARPVTAGVDPALVEQVLEVVPGATASDRSMAVSEGWQQTGQQFVVADDTTLELLGLSDRDRHALDEVGLLDVNTTSWVLDEQVTVGTNHTITIPPAGGVQAEVAAPVDPVLSRAGHWGPVITAQRAAELGLEPFTAGVVIRAPGDLDQDQRDALAEIQSRAWSSGVQPDAFVEPGDPPPDTSGDTTWTETRVEYEYQGSTFPRALVDGIAVGVAMILTLLVVAIGLALSATESRDERDVLVAVGGKPRTLRGLAGVKATVLTLGAAVLAIPTGFIPVAAVLRAAPEDNSIAFPWLTALGLLVAVPVVAGLAALATSALAQRVRPVHMSTLAAD